MSRRPIIDGRRQCSRCGEWREVATGFRVKGTGKKGQPLWESHCQTCRRAQAREYQRRPEVRARESAKKKAAWQATKADPAALEAKRARARAADALRRQGKPDGRSTRQGYPTKLTDSEREQRRLERNRRRKERHRELMQDPEYRAAYNARRRARKAERRERQNQQRREEMANTESPRFYDAAPLLAWVEAEWPGVPANTIGERIGHPSFGRRLRELQTGRQRRVTLDFLDRFFTFLHRPDALNQLYPVTVPEGDYADWSEAA